MDSTSSLNDYDIRLLRMVIGERRSQINEEMRELRRISEHEACADLDDELRDLVAIDKKLSEVLRGAPI
jgi:hypothetical protein